MATTTNDQDLPTTAARQCPYCGYTIRGERCETRSCDTNRGLYGKRGDQRKLRRRIRRTETVSRPERRRAAILAHVRGNPGVGLRALARAVGLAQSTTQHHVHTLCRRGILRREAAGSWPRFYAADAPVAPAGLLAMRERPLASLHGYLMAHPAISQAHVADAMEEMLGWGRSTTQHRLARLVHADLAYLVRGHRSVRYTAKAAPVAPIATARQVALAVA